MFAISHQSGGSVLLLLMEKTKSVFGGKSVLFSGKFRQILPIVPKQSRCLIVYMSLKSSYLFEDLQKLRLTGNMRLNAPKNDSNADKAALAYPRYLLDVGEGKLEHTVDGAVSLPFRLD